MTDFCILVLYKVGPMVSSPCSWGRLQNAHHVGVTVASLVLNFEVLAGNVNAGASDMQMKSKYPVKPGRSRASVRIIVKEAN